MIVQKISYPGGKMKENKCYKLFFQENLGDIVGK